jgi:hypothetical protein
MTNVICNHGPVQTRIYGIGSALRCETDVVREQHFGSLKPASGKRLHSAHRLSVGAASAFAPPRPATVASVMGDAAGWQRARMPRPVDSVSVPVAAAELELPAAVWARLIVARAISA